MTSLPALFGAEPIGRGGGNVESLSGFFARLCVARFVLATHIVREFVVPRCPSGIFPPKPIAVGNFLSQHSAKLDLQGDCAPRFAGVLETLSGLSGLERLAFCGGEKGRMAEAWRPVGRRHKMWCPACFADREARAEPLYEPLLWRFALSERCPVHRVALWKRCPSCERVQPLVTQGVPIGHCVACGHVLHRGVTTSAVDEATLSLADRWAWWRSVALFRVLAWTSAEQGGAGISPGAVGARFARVLAHAVEHPAVPWARSRMGLAALLGIPPRTLFGLVAGECLPTFATLLDSCMQLGVDPVRVLSGNYKEGEVSWPPGEVSGILSSEETWRLPCEVREQRMARRFPERARALDESIADAEALSDAPLYESGGNHASLRLAFPLRHSRAIELRSERLARKRARNTERFDALLDREIAGGARRSLTEIAAALGVSAATVHYYSRDRAARLVAMRQAAFFTRQPGLREPVHAALVSALGVVDGPTVRDVARSLGVPDFVVLSVCPEEYRALVDKRDRERRDRHERYAVAMREDLDRRPPRGVTWVANCLGVCPATLRRADPELYVRLSDGPGERAAVRRRRRKAAARARAAAVRARRSQLGQAVDRELRSDSPRSARAVAMECGVPPSVLRYHYPEQYRRLVELRKMRGRRVS